MSAVVDTITGACLTSISPQPALLQANPGKNVNYLRPYLGFAAIQQEQSNGGASYNAMQVSWNRHFTNNLMFGVSYTWSRSMDDSSNYRDIVPDTYNPTNLWGPSEYDARNMASHQLPLRPAVLSQSEHASLESSLVAGS